MNETNNTLNEASKDKNKSTFTSSIYEGVSVVITAIFIIAFVFTFIFRLVGVSGDSMDNTLHDGDWLIVSPYYSQPEYGDIIISTHVAEKTNGPIVKRVIAVGGDTVDYTSDGTVYVNGNALDEPYIIDSPARGTVSFPVTVPEDCVLIFGDNRVVSWDSRYSDIGFAPEDALLGKAQFRLSKDWNIYYNFNN